MLNPTLPQEHRDWMLRHAAHHTDGHSLALACAHNFGLVDKDGNVLGDSTADGNLLELSMWTHEDSWASHPVLQYAYSLYDLVMDEPDKLWRVVVASTAVIDGRPGAAEHLRDCLAELDRSVAIDF